MPTPERGPAFIRHDLNIRLALVGLADQAGAITFLAGHVLGFIASLERAVFIPDVAGAGAGATQTFRIRNGGAAGTIIATVTVTLANHVLGGAGVVGLVAATDEGVARLKDTDTISITKDAGTVFSTFSGTLCLRFRERLQGRI